MSDAMRVPGWMAGAHGILLLSICPYPYPAGGGPATWTESGWPGSCEGTGVDGPWRPLQHGPWYCPGIAASMRGMRGLSRSLLPVRLALRLFLLMDCARQVARAHEPGRVRNSAMHAFALVAGGPSVTVQCTLSLLAAGAAKWDGFPVCPWPQACVCALAVMLLERHVACVVLLCECTDKSIRVCIVYWLPAIASPVSAVGPCAVRCSAVHLGWNRACPDHATGRPSATGTWLNAGGAVLVYRIAER